MAARDKLLASLSQIKRPYSVITEGGYLIITDAEGIERTFDAGMVVEEARLAAKGDSNPLYPSNERFPW